MAIGDDALAAGMTLVDGANVQAKDIDEKINETRDYIAQRTSEITPVAKGGTGATNPAGARAALEIAANLIPTTGSNVQADIDYLASIKADKSNTYDRPTIDAAFAARVSKSGDTITGNLFLPNSSAASSGWTAAFINSDGRVCRGSSSERYKKYITSFEPQELGDIWPAFVRYKMRADGITPSEEKWRYGYIAERLAEHPDQEQFVVYREIDGETVPDSIDFIGLLMAQVAQLNARVKQLEEGA